MVWSYSKAWRAILDLLRDTQDAPGGWQYGYEVIRAANVRLALGYRVLGDLESEGIIEAEWDVPGTRPLDRVHRPRRRLYRMTKVE